MTARSLRGRRRPAVLVAALTAGLTLGWLPAVSSAQQSPDGWSDDHRAVLPSGLTMDLDFEAAPGITAQAAAGTLDGSTDAGTRGLPAYTDGIRPGAPAQTFRFQQDRPHADGAWRTTGVLRLTFSRPVRNPRLHVSGLAGVATGPDGSTASVVRLTVIGGTPAGPVLTPRSPWSGWTTTGNALAPSSADGTGDATVDRAGSLELDGTFATAALRVEQRDTAYAGSRTPPVSLRQAYTVTLDEALGSAPQGYGNASHVISDLFLGADAAGAVPDRVRAVVPSPSEVQPGRIAHLGNDPAVTFPPVAPIGRSYDVTVPVSPGLTAATLAGWIDFDRNGHFDASERAQADIAPGATSATLEWTVPPDVSAGETWARLRIARDPGQVVAADGFADSGQVEDQAIELSVGAAKPEITEPVTGTEIGDARPRFRGDSGVPGARVVVQEGSVTRCQATVDGDGNWSCRPSAALEQGEHTVLPTETTSGGVVMHGDPVRIAVNTTPPPVPVFTLPASTSDPGLLLTGTGGAGSTITVTEQDGTELCRTAVREDHSWACLPVEDLAEGTHVLTANAVDPAGNRTAGRSTTLMVDTVPPGKPVITSPRAGEELRVPRPRLAGRAEPGVTVTVVSSGVDGVICGAVAAADGSWTCPAGRDLAVGEQLLTATATDPAGIATSGDAVRVRASAPATVSPSPFPIPVPVPVHPSPVASPTGEPSATLAPRKSAAPTSALPGAPDSPSRTAVDVAAAAGSPRRTPAAPPDGPPTVRHAAPGSWRMASCGVLLVLAGLVLLTRRVLIRGSANRRR